MDFETRIDNNYRLTGIGVFDLLIIFKMIEAYTGEEISPGTPYYCQLHADYYHYDDFWEPFELFLSETEIGRIEYEGDCFVLEIFLLSELYKKINEFPNLEKELDWLIQEFITKLKGNGTMLKYSIGIIFSANWNEEEKFFEGCFEYGEFIWHPICEVIIDFVKSLKELNERMSVL